MKLSRLLAVGAVALTLITSFAPPTTAQTLPVNSPVYIPNQVVAPVTLTTTGDYYFNANGMASGTLKVSALSGTFVSAVQGSNDPLTTANASATWTTVYALNLASPTDAIANSITANGFYAFNTAGFTRFRVHVTTLTSGSHTVTLQSVAGPGPGLDYMANPSTIGTVILGAGTASAGNVGVTSDYPYGATPITASATGTTAATTATLAGTSGKTTYICGFDIEANATAAATGNATVTGTITGTLNFTQYTAVNTAGVGSVKNSFSKCVPASAVNTGIAVISAAPSTGGVVSVSAWGYQL